MGKTIKESELYELMRRLEEIDDSMKDMHISAHHADLLYEEKEMILQEIKARGYENI